MPIQWWRGAYMLLGEFTKCSRKTLGKHFIIMGRVSISYMTRSSAELSIEIREGDGASAGSCGWRGVWASAAYITPFLPFESEIDPPIAP